MRRESGVGKNKGDKQEEVTTCAMLLHLASDGTLFLDWVKIGNVTPSGNDTYTFNYGPLESIDTVWNGNSVAREKLEGEYGEIISLARKNCQSGVHFVPSEWFSTTLLALVVRSKLPKLLC